LPRPDTSLQNGERVTRACPTAFQAPCALQRRRWQQVSLSLASRALTLSGVVWCSGGVSVSLLCGVVWWEMLEDRIALLLQCGGAGRGLRTVGPSDTATVQACCAPACVCWHCRGQAWQQVAHSFPLRALRACVFACVSLFIH